jgi:hypothetical protein
LALKGARVSAGKERRSARREKIEKEKLERK